MVKTPTVGQEGDIPQTTLGLALPETQNKSHYKGQVDICSYTHVRALPCRPGGGTAIPRPILTHCGVESPDADVARPG